jgi:two-component system, cell cycle sensor histidine kinase and response regulator CckA
MRTFTIRDVSLREPLASERKAIEEQLRHAQKMDAVGRLAGGIGHDLGNLVAVVMAYAEALLSEWSGPGREDMEAIQSAAERSAHLVRQMMTLARMGPASPAVLLVNSTVVEMGKMLRRRLGENVALETDRRRSCGACAWTPARCSSTWRSTPGTPCRGAGSSSSAPPT